jgi:hypothetical protein
MNIPDAAVGFLLGIIIVGVFWLLYHQSQTKKECPMCKGSGFVKRKVEK